MPAHFTFETCYLRNSRFLQRPARNGRLRTLIPVTAKTAFATAGATVGTPGSRSHPASPVLDNMYLHGRRLADTEHWIVMEIALLHTAVFQGDSP